MSFEQEIDEFAFDVHDTAISKGFWNDAYFVDGQVSHDTIGLKLALVHDEVSEALRAFRKNEGPEAVTKEFADILIRVMDLWAELSDRDIRYPSLGTVLVSKAAHNKTRPQMHGVNF